MLLGCLIPVDNENTMSTLYTPCLSNALNGFQCIERPPLRLKTYFRQTKELVMKHDVNVFRSRFGK